MWWVGFINTCTLSYDTAACVESWKKWQDALFFSATIGAWDVGFRWEMNIYVWSEMTIYRKIIGDIYINLH